MNCLNWWSDESHHGGLDIINGDELNFDDESKKLILFFEIDFHDEN